MDLARKYIVLLHAMILGYENELLRSPYFSCEAAGENEPSLTEVADMIGEGLVEAGKVE